MNKRIVLLFVLGLLLCNAYNVVATPTTSLSDATQEEIIGITWFGYCILLCFLVRYVLPALDFLKGSIFFDKPFVSILIGIFVAFIVVIGLQIFICNKEDIQILFVMMCVSSIFIMGLGDIIIVPEEEKNKKIKQLNIKTKKVSFLFVIPITIAYKWWRLKTYYENEIGKGGKK